MRTIIWSTNINNKLNCNAFIHLDAAPAQGVPESLLPAQVLIETRDKSAPPTKLWLLYFIRIDLAQVFDWLAMASHGLTAPQFQNLKMDEPEFKPKQAIYLYSKSKDVEDFFLPFLDNNFDNLSKPER